jgi:aminopeptidase YwaD
VTSINLSEKAEKYLQYLCLEIPTRRVGSKGNQASTDFFAENVGTFGFQIDCPSFDCIDWSQNGAHLTVDGISFETFVSPYTLGCNVSEPLVAVDTVKELEMAEVANKILLMRGDIAKEQLMPKNFSFYNPDHHRRIIELLELKKPQAIVAATTQDMALAGAVSPFPLIEDGDFDIPSVYMTEDEGERLSAYIGREVSLEIRAQRTPSTGCNVIARKGDEPHRRVVLFAHIDAKDGTPGAIDNATGVVILLLLAELLADYSGQLGIEIVALNGEDYYAASGEKQYLSINEGKFTEIVLGINLDGVGYYQGHTAYSLYDCPANLERLVHKIFALHNSVVEGERWYQSDHGLFLMNQRPALALTSDRFTELWTEIAHTPKDTPEIVDPTKLVEVAVALRELVGSLDKLMA